MENLIYDTFDSKKYKKGFIQYYKCVGSYWGSRLSFDLQKNIIINLSSSNIYLPPLDEITDRNFREKRRKKLETDPKNLKSLYQNNLQDFSNELQNEDGKFFFFQVTKSFKQ